MKKLNIHNVKYYLELLFLATFYIYVLCRENPRLAMVEKQLYLLNVLRLFC